MTRATLHAVAALAFCAPLALCDVRAQEAAATPRADAERRDVSRVGGSIKGRVIDEGGRPVPNVGVTAFSRAGAARASAVSDEAGNFSLDGLDPGLYNFSVQSQGYALARDPATGTFDATTRRRVGDFVTVRLTRGAVITGTVTGPDGEPVIAAPVRAFLVRRPDEPASASAAQGFLSAREFQTDDRGVYRIYGLQPGVYVVSAGGTSQFRGFTPSPYESEAPTFFPSATRDAAAEVVVREGQEAAGIDIRYRGERGRAVSGSVEFPRAAGAEQAGVQLTLVHAATGTLHGQSFSSGREGERGFFFDGVPDGEYELSGRHLGRGDSELLASAPLKVKVLGADVTGLRLTLAPLASVAGRVVLEPLAAAAREEAGCTDARTLVAEEVSVVARRDYRGAPKEQSDSRLSTRTSEAATEANGAFTLRGLDPGRYRFEARPGSEDWYVGSIQLAPAPKPKAAQKGAPAKATAADAAQARDSLQLVSGQRVTGARVVVAEGAASLRGRVVNAAGETQARPRLRVHLVPAERERAEDALRYHESATAPDGSFAFTNVAPGRYLLLTRPEDEAATYTRAPAAWDADSRRELRRAAEAANLAVELKTCQRVADYALRPIPSK
jgi:hypothetical protein